MLTVTPLTIDQAPQPLHDAIRELLNSPYHRDMVVLSLEKSTYEFQDQYFALMADESNGIYLHYTDEFGVIKQEMAITMMKHILAFVERRVAV